METYLHPRPDEVKQVMLHCVQATYIHTHWFQALSRLPKLPNLPGKLPWQNWVKIGWEFG